MTVSEASSSPRGAQPRRSWLPEAAFSRGNVVAGLAVTAYLVPQVMAYATVADLPPIAGLWASLPAVIIYGFLGTSRLLSVGPESSVALMTAVAVAPIAAGDPERYVVLAAQLAILVGLVLLLAALLRLEFVADLLSRPIMVGYMTGIAVLMIEGQIDAVLGLDVSADSIVGTVVGVIDALPDANPAALAISVLVVVVLILGRRWPAMPAPLVAIILATGVAAAVTAAGGYVSTIGTVPQGLPAPSIPHIDGDLLPLAVAAFGVAVVALTDSTLTARAFAATDDPPIRTRTELRALGLSNIAAGMLSGMTVSSSGSRTALAQTAGARSQGYSLVVGISVVAVLVAVAPVMSGLPDAALAALVCYAAVMLVDVDQYRWLWRFSRSEFMLAVLTAVGVLWLGVLYGILVAVVLAVLTMLGQVARPHSAALGMVPGVPGMHDIRDFPEAYEIPGLLVYRYDSTLFFANAEHFLAGARDALRQRQPTVRWFALNCEAIVTIDATAEAALRHLAAELAESGVVFALVRAKRELLEQLARAEDEPVVPPEHVYPTLPTLQAAYQRATGIPPVLP